MDENVLNRLKGPVNSWWTSLLLGIFYLIVAGIFMFSPLQSYITLSIVFSILMLISGILEVVFALSNKKRISSWGWYLVGGAIDIILGIYLIGNPVLTMEIIPFIIAFWLMFRGFSTTGYAMDLKQYGSHQWGWCLVCGILAILCSLLILWQPAVGALYVVYMISFTFFVIGLIRVLLAFEWKKLK